MSLKSWEEKFMPEDPAGCKTRVKAAEHSIKKWKGVLSKNLKRHDLVKEGSALRQTDVDGTYGKDFWLDSDTCALCHLVRNPETDELDCGKCPLTLAGYPSCKHEDSAWHKATGHYDEPEDEDKAVQGMIDELTCALEWARRHHPKS
jgi:hypothetical protein